MNDGIGCDHAMSWNKKWQLLSPARCLTLCRSPSGAWCSSTSWTLSRGTTRITHHSGNFKQHQKQVHQKTSKNWMLISRKTAEKIKSHPKLGENQHHVGPGPGKKGPIEKQGFPTTSLSVDHVMGKPTSPYSVGYPKKSKSKNTGNHRLSYYIHNDHDYISSCSPYHSMNVWIQYPTCQSSRTLSPLC